MHYPRFLCGRNNGQHSGALTPLRGMTPVGISLVLSPCKAVVGGETPCGWCWLQKGFLLVSNNLVVWSKAFLAAPISQASVIVQHM